tara:strand:+ start:24635 stop:25138 length:504 start_codon:yes stop_codon:yes gene_type:complete
MGGGYGGSLGGMNFKALEEKAKEKLIKAKNNDPSRHVFISFAHEDMAEINLFRGQAKNENTDFTFDDHSVKQAYNSSDADYIKRKIREKIDRCSVTAVYLSDKSANSEWVNWEIQESLKRGKGVIGVYKGDTPPSNVPVAFKENKCKAVQWTHENLKKAIEDASTKR